MKIISKAIPFAGAISAVLAILCGLLARESAWQAYTGWLAGRDVSAISTTNHFWVAGMFGFGISAVVIVFAAVRGRRGAER